MKNDESELYIKINKSSENENVSYQSSKLFVPDPAKYRLKFADGVYVYLREKPNFIRRFFIKACFGWTYEDNTVI